MPRKKEIMRYPLPDPIDSTDRLCVKLFIPNVPEHRQAFIGSILRLTRPYNWANDEAHTAIAAAGVWKQIFDDMLSSMYDDPCGDDIPCLTFPPSAPFIEWFPNNPYTEPDLVTEGYNAPAWYQATEASNLILGTQPGDIVTDLTRFPPGSLPSIIPASGLPRFRINLARPGLVRLHLLNILGGSLAQITIDDEITSVRFIDSNRDQLAVPFETATTSIEEVEVTGEGSHHIDVIIVSQINDEIPFLHHGGGLRKIEICGGAVDMPYYELRQNPDDPCIVEQRHNETGEWSEAFRMNNCGCDDREPRYRVIDGVLEKSTDDGETWTPAPEDDPRERPIIEFPPLTADGDNSRCAAANAATAILIEQQQQQLDAKENGANLTELINILVGLLIGLGIISGGLTALMAIFTMALAAFFANLEASSFASAFTETIWDTLNCILFCHTDETGKIEPSAIGQIKADIEAQITEPIARDWLIKMVDMLGAAGLTNASRSGFIGERECDECGCENCSNLDAWSIVYGEIIEQSPGYMRISSGSAGANQAVRIATGNQDVCCFVVGSASGSGFTNTAYYPCGSGTAVNSIPPSGVCGHDFGWTNVFNNPFEMELFFSECE